MNKPDFFIVGAPKCGTTSLYEYLRQHPDIAMSSRKEPHFFAPDLLWRWDWRIEDEKQYLALFADAGNALCIGEASTWYLFSREAPNLIREFAPKAKIIAMVRNPVDMLYSHYWHCIRRGTEDLRDFASALEAEEDRRNGLRIPEAAPFVDALFYRTLPRFAEQLGRYIDTFGREQVHVVILDDLAEDPAREYSRILRFLGVDAKFRPDFVKANTATSKIRTPFVRFLKTHRRIHRFIQATTPISLRRAVGSITAQLKPSPAPPPPVDPSLRAELQVYFAPGVEALGKLLGRDLSAWSRGESVARPDGS